MNEIIEKEMIDIRSMIYEIDGKEVMLDSDLAKLYHVETKRINEAVKNNPEKFPLRFNWVLSDDEKNILWSKFSTANISNMSRVNPRVFTEQGVYMLATVLKSKEAIQTTIRIMDTFVKMRHFINYNKELLPRRFMLLEDKVNDNSKRIDELFDKFNPKDVTNDCIFFENDIYDAYSVLLDIFNMSRDEIIIIDNYAGKELLDMLRYIDKKIVIVSKNINDTLKKKYESQYSNVTFIKNDCFHDRFIIIDRKRLFECGASLKDIGKKCFGIHENKENEYLNGIIETIGL